MVPKNTGYEVKTVQHVDNRYKCPVCHQIYKDPVQLECGHRICSLCLQSETKYQNIVF